MKVLPSLAIAAVVLAAPPAGASENRAFAFTIEPAKVHEECMRMEAGEKRRFHWKSSAPVDFNVHYHEGKDVFFPLKRDAMRGDGGTFTAKIAQEYCWMWTAKNAPATIEGGIELAK